MFCEYLWTLTFNFVTQNTRSTYKNLDGLIAQLSRFTTDIDIIILTECWLNYHKLIPQLDNYVAFCSSNYLNQNDDIVIYVKRHLKCMIMEPEPLGVTFLLLNIEPDIHILAIYLQIFLHTIHGQCSEHNTANYSDITL